MIMKYTSQDISQFIKHASQYFEYITRYWTFSKNFRMHITRFWTYLTIFSNKATLHTLLMTATCSFKSGGHMKNNLRMRFCYIQFFLLTATHPKYRWLNSRQIFLINIIKDSFKNTSDKRCVNCHPLHLN